MPVAFNTLLFSSIISVYIILDGNIHPSADHEDKQRQ